VPMPVFVGKMKESMLLVHTSDILSAIRSDPYGVVCIAHAASLVCLYFEIR